jgi:Na+-transporting NADH:ubiquinone oxidoreductase subunit NqrA
VTKDSAVAVPFVELAVALAVAFTGNEMFEFVPAAKVVFTAPTAAAVSAMNQGRNKGIQSAISHTTQRFVFN